MFLEDLEKALARKHYLNILGFSVFKKLIYCSNVVRYEILKYWIAGTAGRVLPHGEKVPL